ncbi:signal peptide peptidase SppA [Flavobacteriales bacterium]|nr:signal peptide peptidase SppA [Flavobacteriales bacterium]
MKQFFKYFLASGLAYIVFGLIFLFILIGIGGSMFNSGPKPIRVKDNTILTIKLNNAIGERSYSQPTFNGEGIEDAGKTGVNSIIKSIEYAKEDDKIKGIYFQPGGISVGLANLEEIHDALQDFKESGKFIVSYSEVYSQGTYYLASVSDEIYIYPTGSLQWSGLSSERMFFKQMLDKLDVEMQIIRGSNNKFKSAVEPFIMDGMSAANREQTEKYMFSFWDHIVSEVSDSRDISEKELNLIADGMLIANARKAVEYKFATAVKYQDEVDEILKEKVGLEDEKKLETISLSKYIKYAEIKMLVKNRKKHNIAIVYANGEIVSGKGNNEMIGSETTVKHLRKARLNDSIKAIVLRVNSPGGSALASDVIWREIELIKKTGKPVVVSMGDLAASGGYYISCNADRIFAQENTVTGSIGVFGMIPNAERFFENKLGITFDRAKTNEHADLMSFSKPLTDEEYSVIQKEVDRIYDDFITKVSVGRGMTKEMVDSIGQGRVWSGKDAIGINLVDEIGGIDKAVAYAAKSASLENAVTLDIPAKKKDQFEDIINLLNQGNEEESAKVLTGNNTITAEMLEQLNTLKTLNIQSKDRIQARLPYTLKIK